MKISVITTTHNRKEYLVQTIESVQSSILNPLTDVEFEHIIFDDNSTDGTDQIFLNNPYNNVVYIKSEKNNGPSYGRNRAIEKATGDYIFLIDSDDVLLQRTLHNFAQQALQNPQTDWFVSDFIRANKNLQYIIGHDYYLWDFKNPKEALTAIFKGEHFIQSHVFFKKNLFNTVGGFDENMHMSEDLDLFIRFYLSGSMPIYGNFISHIHRNHDTNLSKDITEEKHLQHIQFHKEKYINDLKKHGII